MNRISYMGHAILASSQEELVVRMIHSSKRYYEDNIKQGGNKHEIIKMLSMRQHR